jgi:precorrin-8X/cobalt-precorrin-8 methylmutase
MPDSLIPNEAGDAITRRSTEIILSRLGDFKCSEDELPLVVRVAHTTGDVEFGTSILFSPGAIAAGIAALKSGRDVVVDVGMVAAGLRGKRIERMGGRVVCLLDDPETFVIAKRENITRSAAAMRLALPRLDGSIIAIGNAPTALFELIALLREGKARPALVIGTPVGFVGALESKQELWGFDAGPPRITNLSERGGSPVAVAVVNALVALAEGKPW